MLAGNTITTLTASNFELLGEIEPGLWYAVKKNDYRASKYVAQLMGSVDEPVDDIEDKTEGCLAFHHEMMFKLNQAPIIAQIFNHENIISIAGHIQIHPVVGSEVSDQNEPLPRSRDYIVWDFCDAANLSALFQENPCQSTQFYLPESLCWHVLTSLMRAVTYLHDGKRLFFDPKAEEEIQKRWLPVDHDWNPILHRAIEPRNIFFQHPRGIETYGLCKLGNFELAVVTNHIIGLGDRPALAEDREHQSFALASRKGFELLDITRIHTAQDPAHFTEDERPYALADELWSIGSVVFTMMTGRQPKLLCPKYSCCHVSICSRGGCLQDAASQDGCNCPIGGCKHIPSWQCTHGVYPLKRPRRRECYEQVINIDSDLTRARYSWRLRKMVKELLDCDPGSKVRISAVLPFTKLAMDNYQGWKEGTEEGVEYKDIDDDMMARWEAEKKRRDKDVDMSWG